MVANTETYLDCPFHRHQTGKNFRARLVPTLTRRASPTAMLDGRQGPWDAVARTR